MLSYLCAGYFHKKHEYVNMSTVQDAWDAMCTVVHCTVMCTTTLGWECKGSNISTCIELYAERLCMQRRRQNIAITFWWCLNNKERMTNLHRVQFILNASSALSDNSNLNSVPWRLQGETYGSEFLKFSNVYRYSIENKDWRESIMLNEKVILPPFLKSLGTLWWIPYLMVKCKSTSIWKKFID